MSIEVNKLDKDLADFLYWHRDTEFNVNGYCVEDCVRQYLNETGKVVDDVKETRMATVANLLKKDISQYVERLDVQELLNLHSRLANEQLSKAC